MVGIFTHRLTASEEGEEYSKTRHLDLRVGSIKKIGVAIVFLEGETTNGGYNSGVCRSVDNVCALQADQRRVLIKGGTVVNADSKRRADVYCEDGIIK